MAEIATRFVAAALHPSGEIRGQIQAVPVPDTTATIALLGIGILAAVIFRSMA